MSPPEVHLWQALRQRPDGLKFRRQHPAGPFVLDFSCLSAQLAIEVDSAWHEGREAQDDERDRWFEVHGILTHRVTASAIAQDKGSVIEGICAVARERIAAFEQVRGEYLAHLSSPEGEVARRKAP